MNSKTLKRLRNAPEVTQLGNGFIIDLNFKGALSLSTYNDGIKKIEAAQLPSGLMLKELIMGEEISRLITVHRDGDDVIQGSVLYVVPYSDALLCQAISFPEDHGTIHVDEEVTLGMKIGAPILLLLGMVTAIITLGMGAGAYQKASINEASITFQGHLKKLSKKQNKKLNFLS